MAPADEVARLAAHYRDTPPVGSTRISSASACSIIRSTVVHTRELPPERSVTRPLGRHLDGCRIGFDLGGSDRKVAAVIDGRVVFSEETVWDPYHKPDPQYHFDGIMDSLTQGCGTSPPRGRHRRQRRRRLRQQPGSRRFAVSRGSSGPVRRARQEHVPRRAQGLERRAIRGRERWRGDGARRLDVARRERDSRHRARHQHRGRLRHARGHHHVVARTSSRSCRSTTTPAPLWTSGQAITASARSISRSRPLGASCRLPASTLPPISACPSV